MAKCTNSLIDKYADFKDTGKIYPAREFSYIYSKQDRKWVYEDFSRMTDRLISEQKKEIYDLNSIGTDKNLLTIVQADRYLDYDSLFIDFFSDGFCVAEAKVGTYDFKHGI